MAKNSIRDYDATAANNTDVQSTDISEGCAASGINNAIREVMADLKDVSSGTIALESPQADSLTVTGDLTVDTNTLYVDSTNNNVGIGTTSPDQTLHVHKGSAGSVSSASNAVITVENNADAYIQFLTPNTNEQQIRFGDPQDNGNGILSYNHSDNSMRFAVSGPEKMRILAGGGITFNGDTAAANALDDYEEGSWTPSIGGTATYTHSEGFYTKIGNLVHIHFDIQINVIGTGNASSITNAPFTSANLPTVATGYPISVAYHGSLANTATWLVGYVADAGTSISFAGNNTAATTIQLNGFAVFQNGARIIGSGTYRAA